MIVGMGQVGRALSTFLNMDGHDVEPDTTPANMLHIAYPWTPDFEDTVLAHAEAHGAQIVIVHSTVPVGTCDPYGWVHSPVRGRHPNLLSALEVTTKVFGGRRAREVYWPGETWLYPTAAVTEAGKLWELAQYGVQIRVMQAVYDWCILEGLDPEVVYRDFADDYNADYVKLGGERYIRPVLDYLPGPIGGHCVIPSMSFLDHPLARIVEHGM